MEEEQAARKHRYRELEKNNKPAFVAIKLQIVNRHCELIRIFGCVCACVYVRTARKSRQRIVKLYIQKVSKVTWQRILPKCTERGGGLNFRVLYWVITTPKQQEQQQLSL